jgi:hypothetical protein
MYTRRHLLGALAVTVGTAGCTSALGGDGADGSADPDTVRLDELSVQNADSRSHQLQLAIEADDEMLHLGTYELDGNGGTETIDGEWAESSGSYRVHAKLDEGDVQTADVTDGVGAGVDCVRVLLRIDGDGALTVWNGANCGPNAEDPDLESA